jgi:hypothetical protein
MKSLTKMSLSLLLLVVFSTIFYACKKDEVSSLMTISATLSGASQVPAVTTTGAGTLTGTYDKDTKIITFNIQWKVDGTRLTAMHFHGPASITESAGVVIGFSGYSTANTGTFTGALAALTTAQEADFLAGKWYLNIHSDRNIGGEIRGQVSVK